MENKIKYIIVEDEEKSRETLLKKISLCNLPDVECIGLASNANEAMLLCSMNNPDLLLLDINLPGKDGFELLAELNTKGIEPAVIFTSAHTESHVLLKAFKHTPVNYLVKPINIDELEAAIIRVCELTCNKLIPIPSTICNKVRLQNCYGPYFVSPEQIMVIKAELHYAVMTLNNGESVMLVQSIGEIERQANLAFPPFYKADRSTVLNLSLVENVHIKRSECILRYNDVKVCISIASSRLQDLIATLDNFNKSK